MVEDAILGCLALWAFWGYFYLFLLSSSSFDLCLVVGRSGLWIMVFV